MCSPTCALGVTSAASFQNCKAVAPALLQILDAKRPMHAFMMLNQQTRLVIYVQKCTHVGASLWWLVGCNSACRLNAPLPGTGRSPPWQGQRQLHMPRCGCLQRSACPEELLAVSAGRCWLVKPYSSQQAASPSPLTWSGQDGPDSRL
jgi:hypothetical protein